MSIKSTFIRKRGNNCNVYMEYINEEGKTKQKSIAMYKNKKDAQKHLIDLQSAINNNKISVPSEITFVDRCLQYYTDKSNDYSPTTLKRAKLAINKYVEPFFKNTKLLDVNASIYQKFINHMYSNDLKFSTIKEIINKTDATLHECYRLREISENIPDFIIHPKRFDNSNKDVYSIDEARKILEEVKDHSLLELPLNLFLLAGMRFGEIAGLLWEDVDFENSTLHIKNNLIYVDKKYHLRNTKTKNSTRVISVPDKVISLLKKEKRRQNILKLQGLLNNEFDVVCINTKYRYLNSESFLTSYKKFLERINVRYIRPHSLRHSHATLLILAGTDMKTVSERLGHTDIKMTMNTYSHVLKEMDKTASENIEKVLL